KLSPEALRNALGAFRASKDDIYPQTALPMTWPVLREAGRRRAADLEGEECGRRNPPSLPKSKPAADVQDDGATEGGTLKFYLPERGFGIIVPDAGDDVFAPERSMRAEIPERGARVRFPRVPSRNRPGAKAVLALRTSLGFGYLSPVSAIARSRASVA